MAQKIGDNLRDKWLSSKTIKKSNKGDEIMYIDSNGVFYTTTKKKVKGK